MEQESFLEILGISFMGALTCGIWQGLYNQRKLDRYYKELNRKWKMDFKLFQLDHEIKMAELKKSHLNIFERI
jgi:hypothetical protein